MSETREIVRMRLPLEVRTITSVMRAVYECLDEGDTRIIVQIASDDPNSIVLLAQKLCLKPGTGKGAKWLPAVDVTDTDEPIGGGP